MIHKNPFNTGNTPALLWVKKGRKNEGAAAYLVWEVLIVNISAISAERQEVQNFWLQTHAWFSWSPFLHIGQQWSQDEKALFTSRKECKHRRMKTNSLSRLSEDREWAQAAKAQDEQSYMTVSQNRENNLKTRCSIATRKRMIPSSCWNVLFNICYLIFNLYKIIGLKGNVNKQGNEKVL